MWDEAYVGVVAMLVTHEVRVLAGEASAWEAQEARHLSDRLGLTPLGLHQLGWRLPEPGETGDVVPLRTVPVRSS
jgi:hypothetical protein